MRPPRYQPGEEFPVRYPGGQIIWAIVLQHYRGHIITDAGSFYQDAKSNQWVINTRDPFFIDARAVLLVGCNLQIYKPAQKAA